MGVAASWLAARAAADSAAREATTQTLLPPLIDFWHRSAVSTLQVIDLGAGTGANQRWLAPRLPFPQRWVHVDHDPLIQVGARTVVETRFVVLEIADLAGLLAEPVDPEPVDPEQVDPEQVDPQQVERQQVGEGIVPGRLVTCAALLDVMSVADLDGLCDLLVATGVPALFCLSVTGAVSFEPPDPLDDVLLSAFNAHQHRDGRAGPAAPHHAARRLSAGGFTVLTQDTSWHLDEASDADFVETFLTERVAVAVEQRPGLAAAAAGWLVRRRAETADKHRQIVVGHCDLLALPAPPS